MLSDDFSVSTSTAPTSHALQWRTSLPVPQQNIASQRNLQHQGSSDADWAQGSSRPSYLAEEDQDEGHVHWATARLSHHQHDELAEEAHHRALGMSRRGSFFPGHSAADDHLRHSGDSGREEDRSQSSIHDQGQASASGRSSGSASDEVKSRSHGMASRSLGYEPYSLKDYRDNDYDPKQRSYWMLGTLGKDPDTTEMQVNIQCPAIRAASTSDI